MVEEGSYFDEMESEGKASRSLRGKLFFIENSLWVQTKMEEEKECGETLDFISECYACVPILWY